MTVRMLWLARVALVFLTAAVVAGFFVIDSPKTQRQYKVDEQRVSDLWTVQSAIEVYWWEYEALPASLAEVNTSLQLPTDPVTGESYAYSAITSDEYELVRRLIWREQRDTFSASRVV